MSSEKIDQDTGKFRHYWSSIWSTSKQYQKEVNWIQEAQDRSVSLRPMDDVVFEPGGIAISLMKVENLKSPGTDKLHNFWLKYLTATHELFARCFTEGLTDPDLIPKCLTKGTTFLLLKKGNPTEPNNYRQITCLSVVYKLFTSLIRPHDWLIKTLELYKISQQIIDCLLKIMATWRTNVFRINTNIELATIRTSILWHLFNG